MPENGRKWRRGWYLFGFVPILVALIGGWLYWQLRSSLPQIDGELQLGGLSAPVQVERDALGVPTLRGQTREDLARATGFVHAQDRFFQMDLMRRQAAGELAELIGQALVPTDRAVRVHRFRHRARRVVETTSPEKLRLLEAYVDGVDAGLRSLGSSPFEYRLLRLEPKPWLPEDTILALFAMFLVLNDESGRRESDLGLLYDLLPPKMADFLAPAGTEWDAPLVGGPIPVGPVPGPGVLDLRQRQVSAPLFRGKGRLEHDFVRGSNNWVIAGSRTRDGRAILANDMHLPISVPNTWYRLMLEWPEGTALRQVVGVTLPGAPVIVAGSNRKLAWGFTNTGGDWSDLVLLETDPDQPDRYRTPNGYRPFDTTVEVLRVRGAEDVTLEVKDTIWGPVVDTDHQGRLRALRWTAHDTRSVNLVHFELEQTKTVEEALEVANRSGIPPQNFVCADAGGSIGWTVEGAIPKRVGFSGRVPVSWASGARRWDGWLEPSDYLRIVDPPGGILWTANARAVDGAMLARMGDGGYVLGARARQIRDRLSELTLADETDMLAIQLDDRAILLERWRNLLLDLLTPESLAGNPQRHLFRKLVETDWSGRASIDSSAFRLVRAYRLFAFEQIYGWLAIECRRADSRFQLSSVMQWEGPLWKLIQQRPFHLLDPRYETWEQALLAVVDATGDYFAERGGMEGRTWGERNTTQIQHPLSRAEPLLSGWLDMPPRPLPGDEEMPRVQGPGYGASERLAVSPGHEEDGYFHMPTGQSGHPLSRFYRAGHSDWEEGRPSPFLPGPALAVLTLQP